MPMSLMIMGSEPGVDPARYFANRERPKPGLSPSMSRGQLEGPRPTRFLYLHRRFTRFSNGPEPALPVQYGAGWENCAFGGRARLRGLKRLWTIGGKMAELFRPVFRKSLPKNPFSSSPVGAVGSRKFLTVHRRQPDDLRSRIQRLSGGAARTPSTRGAFGRHHVCSEAAPFGSGVPEDKMGCTCTGPRRHD